MGLPAGIPVVTGAADTAASSLGAGVLSGDRLLVTLGTGGQVVLPVDRPCVDRVGRVHTFCGALPPSEGSPGWYQMGAILSAGMALRWLRDSVFEVQDTGGYDQMLAMAKEAPLGAGGLLFVPYLAGSRTPHMDPLAAGILLGLKIGHGRACLVRSVLEGVAFACCDAYRVLAALGAEPRGVIVAGGGGQSHLWRRIIADVFGLPVRHLLGSDQSALGAAMLAGAGTGMVDIAAATTTWPRYGSIVEPSASNHAAYQQLFGVYQGAYRKHKDDFRSLMAVDARPSESADERRTGRNALDQRSTAAEARMA
jgi:xylulokinase